MKKEKGFTLIELIAVLVIMAILALIVTPLVMSIIRKAKVSADKRSIDAYGRNIELAIAGYLLDNGTFPTSIEQLTIEYSGEEVVCSTTQLNSDSSVYLAGCTVGGRSVDYTYGIDKSPIYTAYSIGDEVTYNNVAYRVIKDSGAKEETVTLLKSEPLTVAEVNQYGGVGTANNHVNMYVTQDTSGSCYQQACNVNNSGYGGMAYYSSATCNQWGDSSGCTADYAQSEEKYVVDAWKVDQAPLASEARLITFEEATNLGYGDTSECVNSGVCPVTENVPSWIYGDYYYWTMSQWNNSSTVWYVLSDGSLYDMNVSTYYYRTVVRPVIVLPKSAL